jgi:(1->4)-alpha-D-glucan 1-alpha-D-glucosylmutase
VLGARIQNASRPWSATYRLQLQAGFTFDDAAAVVDYLAALGVSHVYCSPYLQAADGSTSGYDVVDHSRLNDQLGGAPAHGRMTAKLASAGLGQLLDIVPNHMALAGRANAWWWDVLENGPSSRYASYFDIDWDPPERKLTATVLMPVLGDRYGRVLEAGELGVRRHGGSFVVRYYDHEAPLSPRTLDDLMSRAAQRAQSAELKQLAVDLADLPHAILTEPSAMAERHLGIGELRDRLAGLCRTRPDLAAAVDAEVADINRDPDALDQILGRQNYRLAYWGTAAEELSYRRFFNIDSLAGLRVEDATVFADTHRLVLQLVADGIVDGLRVDHIDGLADPEGYLGRLRDAAPGTYIVVEKILAADEQLPASWPVQGTSGYDFLNLVGQLFVDPDGAAALQDYFARFTGAAERYADVAHAAKLQIMRADLATEVERLTGMLADICERHRRQRDHTRRELRDVLIEVLAAFGVYRTYPRPGQPVTLTDRSRVAAVVTAVRHRRPDLDAELVDFVGELLVLRYRGDAEDGFAVRFAQLSGPVMAKGAEDTAFFRYQPLTSLNEVGGDPGSTGCTVSDFHESMAAAAWLRPEAMLTLSTHDTKRSGDVRARISVLSELPVDWERTADRWAERNGRYRTGGWPDRNAEYLLYQTLVGAWPIEPARVRAFMTKAAREAKTHTSWTDPRADYDAALDAFVAAVLTDGDFISDLEAFLAEHRIVARGRAQSLAQMALLLTCPGIPDLYQGTELWEESLVDPDNRRLVDYDARRRLLADLTDATPEAALARTGDGGPKLWLIQRLLRHRRAHPGCYDASSGYQPLDVRGRRADHAVAFARSGGLAVLVPRLSSPKDSWDGTTIRLPDGPWVSVLTGEIGAGGDVSAAMLLRRFPIAVLGRAT